MKAAKLSLTISVAFAVSFALSITPALAWGKEGHELVGQIAYDLLTPKAKAKVDYLLKLDAQYGEAGCPVHTLADAAEWPDCVRKYPKYNWMVPLHRDNTPVCNQRAVKDSCRDGLCASAAIKRDISELSSHGLPPADQLLALEQLAHFIGDIHQPLHAAVLSDKAGSRTKVIYDTGGKPVETSLHKAWDHQLVTHALKTQGGPKAIEDMARRNYRAWAGGGVDQWAAESYRLAVQVAFRDMPAPLTCSMNTFGKQTITPQYLAQTDPVVAQQLAKAAVRLAWVLNTKLGTDNAQRVPLWFQFWRNRERSHPVHVSPDEE